MFSFLSDFFKKNFITSLAPLPLSACKIVRPYLLEREGIKDGTVILMVVPYFSPACLDMIRNISAYAVARDYHLFFQCLFQELLPLLRKKFPGQKFAAFTDHSPIAEVEAAAMAGLGVIGENHLLLTEDYSSYVFIGEIVTDISIPCTVGEIKRCIGCGACKKICPAGTSSDCLSALTQKKGTLSDAEKERISLYGSAWGCDLCQQICPYTKRAIESGTIFSPIPFFNENLISHLSSEMLDGFSDPEFSERAYAWRGRDTVRRNLLLIEANKSKEGEYSC